MTACADIIRVALGLLRVVSATEAPEAEDAETAIRALNSMMAAWRVDGWEIGWVDVSSPAAILATPEWADEAIGYNLALRLRGHYGVALEPDVVAIAQSGQATISAFCVRKTEEDDKPRIRYPDLPRGTGQRGFLCGFEG